MNLILVAALRRRRVFFTNQNVSCQHLLMAGVLLDLMGVHSRVKVRKLLVSREGGHASGTIICVIVKATLRLVEQRVVLHRRQLTLVPLARDIAIHLVSAKLLLLRVLKNGVARQG